MQRLPQSLILFFHALRSLSEMISDIPYSIAGRSRPSTYLLNSCGIDRGRKEAVGIMQLAPPERAGLVRAWERMQIVYKNISARNFQRRAGIDGMHFAIK